MIETRKIIPVYSPIKVIRESNEVRDARIAEIGSFRQRRLDRATQVWKTHPSLNALEAYEQALDDVDRFDPARLRRTRIGLVVFGRRIPLIA